MFLNWKRGNNVLHGLHARELRQEETGFIDYVFIEQVQRNIQMKKRH